MDFSAWFEAFLDGRWFAFDARHNHPRIGRVVIGRGRDAADVAISTAFGPTQLVRFQVVTEEVAIHPPIKSWRRRCEALVRGQISCLGR
jgi:transglutaminase-like putative cysteine protease